MIPKSLSATAIDTAIMCLRRYAGENFGRMERTKNVAASLGSCVHGALENYVKETYLDKTQPTPDLKRLLAWYQVEAVSLFGTTDFEEYPEGIEMLTEWFKRTDMSIATVISVESKENFALPTSAGPITFNFIWDRFDYLGDGVYKVVDYKSNRWGMNSQQLHEKTQARVYALAAAIKLKQLGWDYKEIWVEFDLLRHDRVGTRFTREENEKTWRKLIEVAERIIKTDEATAPATLNNNCNFCSVKTTCPALLSNIKHGGIMSLSKDQQVDIRAKLEFQKKAITNALNEIDQLLIADAREQDILEYASDTHVMTVTASRRSSVDAEMVERVVGHDLFDRYGGKSLTLANFNKLLKDASLDDNQRKQLNSLVGMKTGEPSIKIEAKGMVE